MSELNFSTGWCGRGGPFSKTAGHFHLSNTFEWTFLLEWEGLKISMPDEHWCKPSLIDDVNPLISFLWGFLQKTFASSPTFFGLGGG